MKSRFGSTGFKSLEVDFQCFMRVYGRIIEIAQNNGSSREGTADSTKFREEKTLLEYQLLEQS